MGDLAQRVDHMRVEVSTPDGLITLELSEREKVAIVIRPGVYERSSVLDLERQLAQVARLLWVARTREYQRIYQDVTGDYSTGDDPAVSERDRAWRRDRDALQVRGESADGFIVVRAVGLSQWQVTVRDDIKRHLDERQFAVSVGEAASSFIRNQTSKLAYISNKHYGDEKWVGTEHE